MPAVKSKKKEIDENLIPQNVEAEEAILGAVLVNPSSLAKVSDSLDAGCFYKPAHRYIYEAMIDHSFNNIDFNGNECKTNFTEGCFTNLDKAQMAAITEALQTIKDMGADYISMPPFELVDITHKWTSWQVAMQVAEMCNSKREPMSTADIISSTVKAYK
jgi:uncharacterized phage-associated protein